MRNNPNLRRKRGVRDPHQRAWDTSEKVALKADCMVWIEVWLQTYEQYVQEFGWPP